LNEKKGEEEVKENIDAAYSTELFNRSKVTNFDKFLIYRYGTEGKYKSWQDVPNKVKNAEIDRAKSVARIRLNIFLMFVVLGAALGYIQYGKKRHEEGFSMERQNIEEKKRLREEYLKEQAEKKN